MCLLRGTDWIFIYNSTFCPQSVFVWIWEQTAIISLYSINWLVSITETEFFYCAVRTEPLHISHMNSQLQTVSALHTRNGQNTGKAAMCPNNRMMLAETLDCTTVYGHDVNKLSAGCKCSCLPFIRCHRVPHSSTSYRLTTCDIPS